MYQSVEQRMSDIYNAGAFERRRITRLMIESLEVAFHLCNSYTEEYSLTKIFDIINSIMPTAYILNTGYWVFYSTQGGQGVCICLRFGLCCPHQRNHNHWVNMEGAQETEVTPFSSTQLGKYWPIDFNIHITPMINDALRSYDVLIKMTVQSYYTQDVAAAATNSTAFIICTEIRYLMTPEYYPHESKIVQFTPHPLTHKNYGKYFNALQTYLDTFGSQSQFLYKNTIVTNTSPKLTIIPYGGTFLSNQHYSYNPRNSFNLSVLNEVNIAIYNENNYGKLDYEKTDVTRQEGDYPNIRNRFIDSLPNYFRLYKTKSISQEELLTDNLHKQKRKRGKYNRVCKDKNFFVENFQIPSTSTYDKENKLNEFFPNCFNQNNVELKINQGVKRKENRMYNSATGSDSFSLPDIVIENSQDANEYLEDISDIIKNDMGNGVDKTIKLEQPSESIEDELFNLARNSTTIRFVIPSDDDD